MSQLPARPTTCLRWMLSLAIVAGGAPPLLAQDQAAALDPTAIVIPADAGHIVAQHAPSTAGTPRTIIHIQDAHTNYGAQKHLAAIIEALATTHHIALVLVEGGQGDASLSYLRDYATPEKRRAVAEEFLRAGKISGEEYADLTATYPLQLWGIESADLYQANLRAFLDTEALRADIGARLEELERIAAAIGARIYPAELQALNRLHAQYEAGTLSFTPYLRELAQRLEAQGRSLSAYPALQAFMRAQALEARLDMATVQTDQTRLMQAIQQQAAPAEWQALMALGQAMQAGSPPQPFYAELARLAARHGFALAAYPHLETYLQHQRLSAGLDTSTLANELTRCVEQLRPALAATPEARDLLKVADEIALMRRLFALQLTPEEHLTLMARLAKGLLGERWAAVLRAHGTEPQHLDAIPRIEAAVPSVQQFYAVARQRNHVMVSRALEKMDDAHVSTAVLIAGGFHTPHLTQFFTERGAHVVVIAPTVTESTDETLYHTILRTQRPRTTPIPRPQPKNLNVSSATAQ